MKADKKLKACLVYAFSFSFLIKMKKSPENMFGYSI